ncbi:hypothetical protein ABTZ99_41890 [Actinosynnema sp. NPDC002837]
MGDTGFEHRSDIPGHAGHEVGLDADLRTIRAAAPGRVKPAAPTRGTLTCLPPA